MYNAYSNSGLNAKFESFLSTISLTEGQREQIISSHTHLRDRNLQPLSYVKTTFLTGSYKRHTMIRPPNDVDIFVVLNYGRYEIKPQAILNKLKSELQSVYPNSTIRQDKPCIVLDFKHCMFELTPAIEEGSYFGGVQSYLIPSKDKDNNWMIVENPNILENSLSEANKRLDGKLTKLIRMMKKCKKTHNIKNPQSCDMERLAISQLSWVKDYRDGIQKLLRIYEWSDYSNSYYQIEQMSDEDFATYCRNTLFGTDFPQ